MNFNDIFKSSFLENVSSISMLDMLLTLVLSFGIGLFIFLIYKKTYQGVMYSATFGTTLIALTMITSAVILAVTSNVVLSLGMVGALSIVRFRTAVKEPTDTAFLFWAIATGIICGAGYVTLSVLMTLLLGLLFVAMFAFSKSQKTNSYLVVVRYDGESDVEQKLSAMSGYRMKNKSMTADYTELVAEMRLSPIAMKRVASLRNEEGVREVSIMASVNGSVL